MYIYIYPTKYRVIIARRYVLMPIASMNLHTKYKLKMS